MKICCCVFKRPALNRALIFLPILLAATASNAVFQQSFDPVFGNLILDTDTGLLWMPVDQTTDLSFSDMQAQFGETGSFFGFRHATTHEVWNMASHFGYDPNSSDAVNGAPCFDMLSLFGDTYSTGVGGTLVSVLQAFSADQTVFDVHVAMSPPLFGGAPSTEGWIDSAPGNPDLAAPETGHFIVRTELSGIPESSHFTAIFALAAIGLVINRRRANRKA